jgi:hypothetical protein
LGGEGFSGQTPVPARATGSLDGAIEMARRAKTAVAMRMGFMAGQV